MPRWMIHLKDGRTLTNADCDPHRIDIMRESFGVEPEDITSVERIVAGRILTIRKSPFIEGFFVATEASRDMAMTRGGGNLPVIIQKRWIGCYLKNSDPPIQCNLVMNAQSGDAWLECFEVKKQTLKGINARRVTPLKKGQLQELQSKQIIDNQYSIIKTPVIKRIFSTENGIGCLFKDPEVRAEMLIRDGNALLGFMEPGEKLKIV